jgi:hypothetical protein
MNTEAYILPAYWASALAYGDFLGLDETEAQRIRDWLAQHPGLDFLTLEEDEEFVDRYEGELAQCHTYVFAQTVPFHDKPCAAEGLLSYRYRGNFDWIMIGASSDESALRHAQTSLSSGVAHISRLEKWNGERYVPCEEPGSP